MFPNFFSQEALLDHIENLGLVAFLRSTLAVPDGASILNDICEMLGLPNKNSSGDMIKSIADEVNSVPTSTHLLILLNLDYVKWQ